MSAPHVHYPKNTVGRDFVIGDLHGCHELLFDEMAAVGFELSKDRMFSVGDLIDRGPHSMECLALYQEDWFHGVLGNHEDMMLSSVTGTVPGDFIWYPNGGGWAEDVDPDELRALAEYVDANVPWAITVDTDDGPVGICHAEPPTGDWASVLEPDDHEVYRMLWSRNWVSAEKRGVTMDAVEGVSRTFHGHSVVKEVVVSGNSWFIDTGALRTGKLTMVQIQGGET